MKRRYFLPIPINFAFYEFLLPRIRINSVIKIVVRNAPSMPYTNEVELQCCVDLSRFIHFLLSFDQSIFWIISLFQRKSVSFLFSITNCCCALAPRPPLWMEGDEWMETTFDILHFRYSFHQSDSKIKINCVEMQFITITMARLWCVERVLGRLDVLGDVPSHSVNCSTRRCT